MNQQIPAGMKNFVHYVKYKTSYPPPVSPLFSRKNWWRIALITVAAVLVGPLIMYKYHRSVPFSLDYYLQLTQYFLIFVIPFVAFLLWVNWRQSIKRSRGYGWLGKFEVINKRASFPFCYLQLAPGSSNSLKVNRGLFEKIRVGDFILVRRDAFGNIEEISKTHKFSDLLPKVKRSAKASEPPM
jgi:hypothetical protein